MPLPKASDKDAILAVAQESVGTDACPKCGQFRKASKVTRTTLSPRGPTRSPEAIVSARCACTGSKLVHVAVEV